MADKRNLKVANDAAESTSPEVARPESEAAAPVGFEPATYEVRHDPDWLDSVEAGLNPYTGEKLPDIPDSDDDLLGSGELAVHAAAAEGVLQDVQAIDVRTDGHIVLKFTKADWPVGLRLGTMPREDIRAVTGELGQDEQGLIAWFKALPGDVLFRDGSRLIFRDDPVDGYVTEVR